MTDVAEIHPRGAMARNKFEPLAKEIFALKKQLNAVILAHNYQVPEIQDVADFVGDSLGLSQQAAKTDADVIVFCGVHFMAETAKILNPNKIVVLPDKDAGCSLEESCPADKLAALQKTNPNFWTVTYINCSAAVKALSDVICTSGNAVKIVEAAPKDRDLLFVPDENLGAWVMEQTGRPMTLWKGNCYAHVEFKRDQVLKLRSQFPDAKVVVHPESLREVRDLADAVCSTEKMIAYCKNDPAKRFVIVTESGIIHRMQKECPGKEFLCAPVFDVMRMPSDNCRCSECKYMKLNTLEKVRDCMKNLAPRIELPEEILKRARLPIERMLEISARPALVHKALPNLAANVNYPKADLAKLCSTVEEYVISVDELYGHYLDSTTGFGENYRRMVEGQERSRALIKLPKDADLDAAAHFIGRGNPNDPSNRLLHKTTQGEFKRRNAPGGRNHVRATQLLIVLLYTFWEHYRKKLAASLGLKQTDELEIPLLGDLRLLRHDVVHHRAIVTKETVTKLVVLRVFQAGAEIILPEEAVETLVRKIKGSMDELLIQAGGKDPQHRTIWHVQ